MLAERPSRRARVKGGAWSGTSSAAKPRCAPPSRLTLPWWPCRRRCQCSPPTALRKLRGGGYGSCTMGTDQRGRIVGGILISPRSARDRTSNRRCVAGCGRVEAASCPGLSTHDSAGYIWNECCECPNRRLYRAQASGNSRMQPGNSRIQAAQKERFDEGIRPAIWNCWADSFVNAGSQGHSRPRKKITSAHRPFHS